MLSTSTFDGSQYGAYVSACRWAPHRSRFTSNTVLVDLGRGRHLRALSRRLLRRDGQNSGVYRRSGCLSRQTTALPPSRPTGLVFRNRVSLTRHDGGGFISADLIDADNVIFRFGGMHSTAPAVGTAMRYEAEQRLLGLSHCCGSVFFTPPSRRPRSAQDHRRQPTQRKARPASSPTTTTTSSKLGRWGSTALDERAPGEPGRVEGRGLSTAPLRSRRTRCGSAQRRRRGLPPARSSAEPGGAPRRVHRHHGHGLLPRPSDLPELRHGRSPLGGPGPSPGSYGSTAEASISSVLPSTAPRRGPVCASGLRRDVGRGVARRRPGIRAVVITDGILTQTGDVASSA